VPPSLVMQSYVVYNTAGVICTTSLMKNREKAGRRRRGTSTIVGPLPIGHEQDCRNARKHILSNRKYPKLSFPIYTKASVSVPVPVPGGTILFSLCDDIPRSQEEEKQCCVHKRCQVDVRGSGRRPNEPIILLLPANGCPLGETWPIRSIEGTAV
jgi:hypothetical protein